jgi:cytoskeletal protein CcmA (bactofilin family)
MKKSFKANQTKELTIIPENTKLEGGIEAAGRVLVIGSFTGTMKANALEVFKGGSVNATVEVEDAVIGGEFEGEMVCNAELLITSKAVVKGRLLYGSLRVESGVLINASVSKLESEDRKLLAFQQRRSHH